VERGEGVFQLTQLGPCRALVDPAEKAQPLQAVDCLLAQLAARALLDRGLT
jgi:hypothetical protein